MNELPSPEEEIKKEKREFSEEEIRNRLHVYHEVPSERWASIRQEGGLLSEKQLIEKGIITLEDIDKFGFTSTTNEDRRLGRDEYVYATTVPLGYGDVLFEIDLDQLLRNDAKVATAGDFSHYVGDPDEEDYHQKSIIPASEFVNYLVKFINSLGDPEWFFGKRDERLQRMMKDGLREEIRDKNPEKIRTFWKLFPEIMFRDQVPLSALKRIH